MILRRRDLLVAALAVTAFAAPSRPAGAQQTTAAPAPATARRLPARLTDAEFWKLSTDFSEPGGYFRFENFLSNEGTFQVVVPQLQRSIKPGTVYFGVGPEQNFTYIAELQPAVAFIFDIRRGNLHEQLLYKALFELSADRAEFVSRLFSKPRPARLDSTVTVDSIFNAFWYVPTDSALYQRNLAAVKSQLLKQHGLALSDEDINGITYVYDMFYRAGPRIDYSFPDGPNGRTPNYADLMVANDGTGVQRSFLATEARFRFIRDLQMKNLIVPVVGDFGGPKAIRAAGDYVRAHGGIVSAIYASNVEQYLFQSGDAWRRYYESVATLPLDSTSTFIRSVGSMGGGGGGGGGGFMRLPSVLSSVQSILAAYRDGRITSYYDVIQLSR
jgi:hypothetical protein